MSNDVRVLHINYNFVTSDLHGEMVKHLDPLVERNAVFAATKRNIENSFSTEVEIVKCYNKYDRYFFHLKQNKIKKALEKKFDINDFNIIHAYTLFTDGNCAYEMKKKYGIPYIVAIRDTDVNAFFKYAIHLQNKGITIMKNASAIIFLSESYQRFVTEKYVPDGIRTLIMEKSYVIPNGIDDFWIDNKNIPKEIVNKNEIKVISVGKICDRKNPLTTMKALKLLINKGYKVTFNLIGKNENDSIYTKLKRENFVNLFPPCDKEELIDYYRKNDILVIPSKTESFGLVYAEAMSQGLPVIYSKGQGFDEQFKDGFVGYGVEKQDSYDIAAKILQVMTNYNMISKNCISSIDKFNWNDIVKRYVTLYMDIIRIS